MQIVVLALACAGSGISSDIIERRIQLMRRWSCGRSAPTQSLQKHLAAGKAVVLARARAGSGAAISHLLLQREGETFLHELYPPVCAMPLS